jgi:aspartyl-tRNA(Asn)/glutamyl-tRNA(Gln) amidotransferase subunit A
VPIKPPYLGRVAGPITRSVADAALLMATLSRPDVRDATSLPYSSFDWADLERDPAEWLRGKRIGLLLDAGWGLPLDPEIRAAVRPCRRLSRRSRRASSSRCARSPRARWPTASTSSGAPVRGWTSARCRQERQALVLPFIRDWVAAAAGFSAAQLFHGYSQFAVALRDAAVAACQPFDFVLSPVARCGLRGGMGHAHQRPAARDGTHRLHPALQHERAAGHQRADSPTTAPACPSACRSSATGTTTSACCGMARAFELLRGTLAPWPRPPSS